MTSGTKDAHYFESVGRGIVAYMFVVDSFQTIWFG